MTKLRLIPLLLAMPALAADPGLATLAGQVDAQGSAGLAAAYAACLAGQGDVERTAAFFVAKGWSRHQDDETGQVELLSDAAPYRVTVYLDAPRCEVGSETLGAAEARAALSGLAQAAGASFDPVESAAACTDVPLGQALVRLAGRGAPCAADAASAAIFRFPGGPDA